MRWARSGAGWSYGGRRERVRAILRHRWLPSVLFIAFMAFQFFQRGFDLRALAGFIAISLFWGFYFHGAGIWRRILVPRPWRSYLLAALVSAGLALTLFSMGADPIVSIFWLALSALVFAWAWYWERTEPLPPKV